MKTLIISVIFVFCIVMPGYAESQMGSDDLFGLDLPIEKGVKPNIGLCRNGAETVAKFLKAWERNDYKQMYDLIDDESKANCPAEETQFYFHLLDHKSYSLSQVYQNGGNFDFYLSSGEWADGDKTLKKITISGKSFKIIMRNKMSPFTDSVDSNL